MQRRLWFTLCSLRYFPSMLDTRSLLINENCHCLESAKKLVLLKYNAVNVLFALKDLQNGQMLLFDILM